MAQPIPGWYPDPSGDVTKLRYWDGTLWTDEYRDAPASASPEADTSKTNASTSASETSQSGSGASGYATTVSATTYSTGSAKTTYSSGGALYSGSKNDETLRLVAFVFALLATICWGFFIIPLAWMIPLTVMCWKTYKGTRPNTVALGVCMLIFCSLVSGILLLISQKDA